MWDLKGADDNLRLSRGDLTSEELGKAMQTLLGKDPGSLPVAYRPLYCHGEGAELDAAMPAFNERGLMPSGPPNSLVLVSSGNDSVEWEEEEETTLEGMGRLLLYNRASSFGVFLTTTTP